MISFNQQSIFSRYVSLAGANFISAVFGFIIAALLARQFGPAGFGEISLVASLVSYLLVLANCGTGLHAVRVVAMGQSTLETMIPTVVTLRLILGAGVFLLLVLSTYLIPKLNDSRLLVLLYGLTLFSNAISLMWAPQAVHRTNSLAIAKVFLQFINLSVLYLLLLFDSQLYMVPIAVLIAELMVAAGLFISIQPYVGRLAKLPTFKTMLALLRESAPIGATQLVRAVVLASDLIIIGLLLPWGEVGVYAVSFKIFLFLLGLGSAYFVILLPKLAEVSHSIASISIELRASFKRVFPIVLSAAVVIWVSADVMIDQLFGSGYDQSAAVLRVLSIAFVVNITGRHYRQVLLVKKMQVKDLRLSGISAVAHFVSKLVLVPFFGILGCAVGTVLGEIVLFVSQRIAALKVLKKESAVK